MENSVENKTLLSAFVTGYFALVGGIVLAFIQSKQIGLFFHVLMLIVILATTVIGIAVFKSVKNKDKLSVEQKYFGPSRDLTEHHFFNKISYTLSIQLSNLKVEHPAKKAMLKKFLTVHIETMRDIIKDNLCRNEKCQNCHKQEAVLLKWLETAEKREIESGVPQIFLDKLSGYKQKRAQIALDGLHAICASGFYSSGQEKMAAILDMYATGISSFINDLEIIISAMNGELEKALENKVL